MGSDAFDAVKPFEVCDGVLCPRVLFNEQLDHAQGFGLGAVVPGRLRYKCINNFSCSGRVALMAQQPLQCRQTGGGFMSVAATASLAAAERPRSPNESSV